MVQDEDWGAGHQAFFLYLVLHSLDTNYSRFFGWRQATIWGVEEPESGLHRDLETRLAGQLREWSHDRSSKLQIVLTTHSAVFTMASDAGYWLEVGGSETLVGEKQIPELTRSAEREGVTGWVHPVLSFPWNPVVLVEGRFDVEALSHAAAISGHDNLRFLTVPELDPSQKARGKDAIVSYIGRNASLIHNRPRESPLIVVLDWDASKQELQRARKAYGRYADGRVIKMDEAHCFTVMGTDFRGIERFYPPEIVIDAHNADELTAGIKPGKPYSISKKQLDGAKHHLSRRLKGVDDPAQLEPLIATIRSIQTAVYSDRPIQAKLFSAT